MAIRIRRSSVIWLAIAAVMFVLSFIFTMMVTWVGHEDDSFEKPSEAKPRPDQIVSIFRITPNGNKPYVTNYIAAPHGGTDTIDINVVAEDAPVILINNLADAKSCFMLDPRGPMDQKPAKGDDRMSVQAFHSDIRNQRVFRLTPHFGSLDRGVYIVRCKVKSVVEYETFTDRSVELSAYNPFWPQACARPLAPNARDCDRELLDGLEPRMMPTYVDFNFSRMRGIDNLHYSGGYQDEHAEGREFDRGLGIGRRMFVLWEDIYRQQLRDTLLIIIGTLIGIGVTVLIEGIRPYLESLAEKEDGPPPGSSAGPPTGKPPEPKPKTELPSFRPAP
jgi:hypothetical protein